MSLNDKVSESRLRNFVHRTLVKSVLTWLVFTFCAWFLFWFVFDHAYLYFSAKVTVVDMPTDVGRLIGFLVICVIGILFYIMNDKRIPTIVSF